jgi:hypothetical protein
MVLKMLLLLLLLLEPFPSDVVSDDSEVVFVLIWAKGM